MRAVSRILLLVLSVFGTLAATQLVVSHLQTGAACPLLGLIPACYIVAIAYALIFVSGLVINRRHSVKLFLAGWASVFGIAVIGVALELMRGDTCPAGPANIPQCYISLTMALMCAVLFCLAYPRQPKHTSSVKLPEEGV